MVLGELGASLTSEMLPDTLLVAVGANCTLKVLDCPAGRVSGNVRMVMVKACPPVIAKAMIQFSPPEFVKVRFCTPVLPTSFFFNDTATTEIYTLSLHDALPISMVLGELGASLTSEMPPDALPVVVGANCTLKVLDCPGGRVSGKLSPLMLKPGTVTPPRAIVK